MYVYTHTYIYTYMKYNSNDHSRTTQINTIGICEFISIFS